MTVPVVHVVDDDSEMRNAVERILRVHGHEVRTYASAGDFLLARAVHARDCMVLDLQMPGPSGLDLQEALVRDHPMLPIVFMSGHGDIASSVQAMKKGAVEFLTKPVQPQDLLAAVEGALALAKAHDERGTAQADATARHALLTPREQAVFAHVVAGEANKVIARALGITESTVKMHRAQVMAKLQAGSVADLVRLAARLLPPAPRD
jgi:FixJ family two-component response regulator